MSKLLYATCDVSLYPWIFKTKQHDYMTGLLDENPNKEINEF